LEPQFHGGAPKDHIAFQTGDGNCRISEFRMYVRRRQADVMMEPNKLTLFSFVLDTVFCVPMLSQECPPCTSKDQRQRGLPEYWWREADLVQGKGNPMTGATDPWKNVGSGIRLDGKSTSPNLHQIEGLSEEEMIQMALAASMEPMSTEPRKAILTPEPSEGTSGTVRIQIRLPDSRRVVRRFLGDDPVAMVYAFVESESSGGQCRAVELRAGFPLKDLQPVREKTIKEAGLAGEAIQCRYV